MIEWQDAALVLHARSFGNADAILTVLTPDHGKASGLVKGGQSKTRQANLQPGCLGQVEWRAALDEQLGQFSYESEVAYPNFYLEDRARLIALESLCTVLRAGLAEREPVPSLFQACCAWLEHLEAEFWAELFVKLELTLLHGLGFAVDFSACALGGSKDDLSHVSPKSGRAVCRELAGPYLAKLLPLPQFLGGAKSLGAQELSCGLALTGHLLERHIFHPINQDLPHARKQLKELLFIPE